MMTSGVAREEGTNVHDVHVIVTEQGAPAELTVRQPAGE
jgi:hypothetical protein